MHTAVGEMGPKKNSRDELHKEGVVPDDPFVPAENITLSDPNVIPLLIHDKKKTILELLIIQEKTIMELSKQTNWNPGTIKRHLLDLLKGGLIRVSREELNRHNIRLIYYRAVAKHFIFQYEWP
jgi:DNA-binding transcriptional ArsR family regulator